jgi:hypothetical protein
MIYSIPPAPPILPEYQAEDCKKGSRDCFPENLVGGFPESALAVKVGSDYGSVSLLLPTLAVSSLVPTSNLS